MKNRILAATAALASVFLATPAAAQDADETTEMYYVFHIDFDGNDGQLKDALKRGMKKRTSDTQVITPLVRGRLPEEPGTFELYNPLEDGRFAALGALVGQAQAAEAMQVRCEGASFIAHGFRRIAGSQRLRVSACLFPYQGGYNLDIYAIDIHRKGGSVDARIGRAIAGAIVGKPKKFTDLVLSDLMARIVEQGADVTLLEGQPGLAADFFEKSGVRPLEEGHGG